MLKTYFDDLSADLARESEPIREFFATHNPSAGTNREDLVAKLLKSHVLPTVGVETGLVLASSGELSNQSDIILVDRQSNNALHGARPIPLWLMEAVYGVIEVKTQLTPTTLRDSIKKSIRLKTLPKHYADAHGRQNLLETLFSVWSFEAPQDLTLTKANITDALAAVPYQQQPDFIVVPGRFLWRGGHYFDLCTNGQPGSQFHTMRLQQVDGDPAKLVISAGEMLDLGANTLVTFLYWRNSWLYAAGPRRPNLVDYYPMTDWGTVV